MYTEKDLKAATRIIKQIACTYQVSEKQVRSDMEEAMNAGRYNPDPAVRTRWETFRFSAKAPTAEEYILWAAALAKLYMGRELDSKILPPRC